jgi:hypothetical protein
MKYNFPICSYLNNSILYKDYICTVEMENIIVYIKCVLHI